MPAVLFHVLNFLAPAAGVALMLSLFLWLVNPGGRLNRRAWIRAGKAWLWLFLSGLAVLLAGLAYFGNDGKVATYAALVLVTGSVAWWRQSVRT